MKRVININFQGRIIPIEETAYQILQGYIESLRRFFANEEGRDEIINDIEGRIAELFSENLKKGNPCITDEDVNAIIASMGRPEDFDEDESKIKSKLSDDTGHENVYNTGTERSKRSIFRDDNDKILGGVCSGIGNYLRVDPSIVRILFVIITFGGFGAGFLLYLLMWVILPSSSAVTVNFQKRLFRNPDDRVVAGVASGLAAYFDIGVWIPRLIFAFPLVIGVVVSIFRNIFWHFNPFPQVLFGSFGTMLFVIYLVLWFVLPEANTASEKLEMRGEKVNLNSIKNTIQDDLEGFKNRADKWGKDIGDKAKQLGENLNNNWNGGGKQQVTSIGSRIFHAIGILFKAFFLFLAGILAFALTISIIGLLVGGVNIYPLKDYFIQSGAPTWWLWGTIVFFLLVPVLGLVFWLIRRIFRVKSKSPSLGFIFSGLWVIGWVCAIMLLVAVTREYKVTKAIDGKINIPMPSKGKLYITAAQDNIVDYYHSNWYGIDWDSKDAPPLYGITDDSMMVRTIRVNVVKSTDSAYHISIVKLSHGNTLQDATNYANRINFTIDQKDSIVTLPQGFAVTKDVKFHNQQVLVIVAVPVGKKIELNESLNDYNWFNLDFNRRRKGFRVEWDDDWNNNYDWNSNTEYIMTANGLKNTQLSDEDKDDIQDTREKIKEIEQQKRDLEKDQNELKKQLPDDIDSAKKGKANVKQASFSAEHMSITLVSALKTKFCL